MPGFIIHITGRVQGVGFRPRVYSLAKKIKLKGWVRNDIDGVRIKFNALDEDHAIEIYKNIIENVPHLSIIKGHSLKSCSEENFKDFQIIESSEEGNPKMLISPDFALCETCRRELLNPNDKRNHYAFITCTVCGPRYSIINLLPYDRKRTAMDDFTMCEECKKEYNYVFDRRYYSQTNSCPKCPVIMELWDSQKNKLTVNQEEIIKSIKKAIFQENKIVAVKGIGGYLLLANACDGATVKSLRSRKNRDMKPFALIYPNVEVLTGDVHLSQPELKVLKSEVCPIILLNLKEKPNSKIAYEEIALGLNMLGVMLPYTGLLELIMAGCNQPVVATSGNLSDAPIIYSNEKALHSLGSIADYVVTNNRKISIPQDDSVVRFSAKYKKQIIIRRSRGLAPSFQHMPIQMERNQTILAMGADLKSSFSIYHEGELYTSQYLGDLSDYESEQSFINTLRHLLQVLRARPQVILMDKHPNYASTRIAETMASKLGIKTEKIQHHQAHFTAVMAENNLINTSDRVLGIIWDGTGYGDDQNIWGGELFSYDNYSISRLLHVPYYNHIAGDKMAKEPRISCLSLLAGNAKSLNFLKSKFSEKEWFIYSRLLNQTDVLQTSSMGRVFDAVSSLLGYADYNDYEGQAAMILETAALNYISAHGIPSPYAINCTSILPIQELLNLLFEDVIACKYADYCAARFHVSLADIIEKFSSHFQYENVAFSGGVFQNALLVDLIIERLDSKYNLYFHRELSPNDENISYGQIAYYDLKSLASKARKDNYLTITN